MKTRLYKWLPLFLIGVIGCGSSSPEKPVRGLVEDKGAGVAKAAAADPAVAQKPPTPGERFSFPNDQGGKLLGEMLRPPEKMPGDAAPSVTARQLPGSPAVERPEVTPGVVPANLPRAKLVAKTAPLRPHALPEGTPLADVRRDPVPTTPTEFVAGAPIRLPSLDVNRPVPLPLLSHLTIERAPLDDPTADESVKAALSAPPPVRTTPTPFTPRNLPDPFVNAQTVKVRTPPPEQTTPVAGPPRPPSP